MEQSLITVIVLLVVGGLFLIARRNASGGGHSGESSSGYREHKKQRRKGEPNMRSRFAALRGFAKVLVYVGYTGVALGVLGLIFGAGAVVNENMSGGALLVVVLGAGLWSLVALLVVAAGQMVRCFLAIEQNTRGAAE